MTQRNSHDRIAEPIGPPTIGGAPRLRNNLLLALVLVLLITNGGAG